MLHETAASAAHSRRQALDGRGLCLTAPRAVSAKTAHPKMRQASCWTSDLDAPCGHILSQISKPHTFTHTPGPNTGRRRGDRTQTRTRTSRHHSIFYLPACTGVQFDQAGGGSVGDASRHARPFDRQFDRRAVRLRAYHRPARRLPRIMVLYAALLVVASVATEFDDAVQV